MGCNQFINTNFTKLITRIPKPSNDLSVDVYITHLEVFLVESEVVESVGEGVHDGDELVALDVGLGVQHEGDVERLLLPHEGVEQLHEGGRQITDELHLFEDADADAGGDGSDLKYLVRQATYFCKLILKRPLEGTGC